MFKNGRLHRAGLVLAITAMVALIALPVWAASDGALGFTSTGTSVVSVVKGDQVQITGLTDINLGTWQTGDGALGGASGACVFTTTGNYRVTASSSNTTGTNFRMADGFGAFIVYTVQWNDGTLGLQGMTGGTALTGMTGDAVSANCSGGLPAAVTADVTGGQMNAAAQGAYTDTLTLLVAPE